MTSIIKLAKTVHCNYLFYHNNHKKSISLGIFFLIKYRDKTLIIQINMKNTQSMSPPGM